MAFKKIQETVKSDGQIVADVYKAPRPLTASATKINVKDKREEEKLKKRLDNAKWQKEAWDYYDYIGEIKYAANLVANVLSRINIYVAYNDDSSRIPTPIENSKGGKDYSDTSNAILELLESGDGGSSGLLRDAALNMFIAGEYYLVREPAQFLKGIPEKWQVRSIDEIVVENKGRNKGLFLRSSRTEDRQDWLCLPEGAFISRMWRRHPRFSAEADSSLRGILEDCDDLLVFSREGRNNSRSRMPAGVFFLPDGLDNSAVPDSEDDEFSDGTDDAHEAFSAEFTEALVGPAMNDEHPNSYAPLVMRGPAEMGEKIKYFSFSKPVDPMFENLVAFKLDRILQALDIPKDIAKGLSAVKYSNGILIEESLYKAHIEPLTLLIVDSLTNGFLRPALAAQGIPDEEIAKIVIWYDPSAITAKPSKAEAANFGVENNIVSGKAWRAANGFSEADAPDEQELAQKLVVSKLILDPQMSTKLLDKMLPETMKDVREESLSNSNPSDANALNEALAGTPADPLGTGTLQEPGVIPGAIQDGPLEPTQAAPPGLIEP